jgi:ribonucleoside-triphosphate reductase
MNVIKRDGTAVPFDKEKIVNAINKAFIEVDGTLYEDDTAKDIADEINYSVKTSKTDVTVETIQDWVENYLMDSTRKDVARAYIRYRYKKEIIRQTSETYDGILSLVEMQNDELKDENSNKNAVVASTQRDYMAGEVSKDLTNRVLLPTAVVKAHMNGEIHFHDADYFAQHIPNCCLVNLEDMFQHSTVINKTLIEKPHNFDTVCNVATQIMAVIASGQYGGQSITLSHLAPFVEVSRQKIRRKVEEEVRKEGEDPSTIERKTERRLMDEIKKGVQTIQYQINTLNTSNGQTPFVTIFMYLGEVEDPQTKADLALVIEEVLKQRIQGVKNEAGVWVTPAFPKLIYVLEEDNIHEDSKYWYLTELAAKCTAKRLVPDYISEKVMKRLKDGNCYPVMGCRSALTVWKDENGKPKFYGRFNAQ